MKKKNKNWLTGILIIGALLAVTFFFPNLPERLKEISSIPSTKTLEQDELEKEFANSKLELISSDLSIYFIDVGQADSILITSGGSSMLIDAGNNADGKDVVEFLKSHKINKLDYVIGTHPHEDHIGGLDNVIYEFDIAKIIMPKVQNNTRTFEDVIDAVDSKKIKITSPKVGDKFPLGEATFTILSANTDVKNELNLCSIVIRLDFGECSYIFCGDAEVENEEEMLRSSQNLKADIIKIGHHGSVSSSSEAFIKAVDPEIAIICVGEDNDYGHPHKETLNLLNKLKIPIFRTDLNGTITITSDGKSNKISLEKK